MKKILLLFLILSTIQVNSQIITTIAGDSVQGFSGDGGQATIAELNNPTGVAVDIFGNVYISDGYNDRVRKVSTSGIINTFAGGGTSGLGDGGPATSASLNVLAGITVDKIGNVYITDFGNNRIRKVNTSGIISTIAGNGTATFSGDGGLATNAALHVPNGVAIDRIGNVYIADASNNRIRKIDTFGIINTIAGNGTASFSGDGGAAISATLNYPAGVAVDSIGNIFFSDFGNNRIRKIDIAGIITTVAGDSIGVYSGDGGPAINAGLTNPTGVAVDAVGNIYITDNANQRIRKVDITGIITTIAGNGTPGFSGDGGLSTSAEINYPWGIAADVVGNIYFTDYNNNRVRKITNTVNGINQTIDKNKNVVIYPNPTSDQFFVEANTTDMLTVDVYDLNGRHVFSSKVMDKSNINVATLDNGTYSLTIKTADRVINKKLVILR